MSSTNNLPLQSINYGDTGTRGGSIVVKESVSRARVAVRRNEPMMAPFITQWVSNVVQLRVSYVTGSIATKNVEPMISK